MKKKIFDFMYVLLLIVNIPFCKEKSGVTYLLYKFVDSNVALPKLKNGATYGFFCSSSFFVL